MESADALTFVENLAEKVVGHDYTLTKDEQNAIELIENFINRILRDIITQREEDQSEVNLYAQLIRGCSTTAKNLLEDKVDSLKQAVQKQRLNHSGCRSEEETLVDDKTDLCKKWDDYRQEGDGRKVPECMSKLTATDMGTENAEKKEKMEKCLEEIDIWFRPLWPIYIKCRDSRKEWESKTQECNGYQKEFEAGFCQYSLLLSSTCSTQSNCRQSNIKARNKGHANVTVAEAARHTDCEVGHKVKCLLKIFEEKNNTKKPGMLAACKALEPKCPEGIAYPDIPLPQPCETEPYNPCDSAWLEGEYSSEKWFAKAPSATCTPCLKAATKTTIASPEQGPEESVSIANRYPAPPHNKPEWPRIVGQGSWFNAPLEKVKDGKCTGMRAWSAYNMLWGCTNYVSFGAGRTSFKSAWRAQDCNRDENCADMQWFTMDLGSVQLVKSIEIYPWADHSYKTKHYELLISENEPGPKGPYLKTVPSFDKTSKGFIQVVDSGDLTKASPLNKDLCWKGYKHFNCILLQHTHKINREARFVMFHALAFDGSSAGVRYMRVKV